MVLTAASYTQLAVCLRLSLCLIFTLSVAVLAQGQTSATYHLHKDASTTATLLQLKTAGPDAASVALQTANLKNQAVGEKLIRAFDTQSGVPNANGVIASGSAVTFTVWMKKTGNSGTMFPRVKLNLNSSGGTSIFTVTGTTALSTTLTKYILTGTVPSNVSMSATDRFYLWVGVNLTVSPNANTMAELDVEGTLNGNYDSQINVPLPNPPPPSITSLSQNSGPVGASITITGTNFGATQGTSTVTFNGTAAAPTSWGATSITAPVPAAATTGPVVVTVSGQASNGVTFTVTPKVDSLNPTSGPVGTSVTISGSTFGATQGTSTVKFNGTTATPTSWTATSIAAPVPTAATTGPVVVTVNGNASNGVTFTVTPKINSLNPTSGVVGTSVTISGNTFGPTQGTSTVTFNGTTATPTSWTATSIAVPVPAAATTGPVVVTVNGQASNSVTFTVTPVISTLTPNAGLAGTSVTVAGTGFGATQGTSTIQFNGTTASPTSWNSTQIVAPVPAGATTGNVVVTVQSVVSAGKLFYVTLPPVATITAPANGAIFDVPAFVQMEGTASDPDGTIAKVEFYVANTKIGEDTTAPYSFLWRNAPAGSHSLSVEAVDNVGARTRSAAIAITVNAIPVPPEGAPCSAGPAASFQFIPHDLGDYNVTTINLAPCETIEVREIHDQMNDGNLGTNLRVAYYNNEGLELHSQVLSGFFDKNHEFPAWTPEPFPWRGVRAPAGLPAYLYVEAVHVLGHGSPGRPYYPTDPVYNFSITRAARQNYNLGGTTIQNAPVTPYFPYTYYGSLRVEELQGQYYKFRLEPGQSVRATGLVEGNQNYGALFKLDIYDAVGNLITTNPLGWTLVAAYGPKFYTTSFFVNPNPTASDFYVRAQSTLWPVYDFDITLEVEACPVPSENDPNTPDATGMGPLTPTSAEYQFPAGIDTDVLPPNLDDFVDDDPNVLTGREVELWARVYRPTSLSGGPYPLIVFLHGNHGTCGTGNPRVDDDRGYTLNGMCGFVPFFISGGSGGSLRNDSNDWLGMKVTIGAKPVVLKSLGRLFNPANSGSHTVKVVRISDNSTVASVLVPMTGVTAGTFKYQNLPSPVTLPANTSYYIVSQEFHGGDTWADSNTTAFGRDVATINAAVSSPDGVTGWNVGTTPGRSYGLLDFKYDLVAPDNYTIVPNHRGYDYLANNLASRGYIVVSINANRGITQGPEVAGDRSLIMARGRLVLRHLQRLREWNANGGTPPSLGVDLQGKLDFTNVGLMGHSRGGEGVRAAQSIYTALNSPEATMWQGLIPNLQFKGIFEIAPTDDRRSETGTGLVARGTNWNVLLPICDGDVFTLEGVRAFDRLLALTPTDTESPTPKSTYTVWGANHNFYNTEWKSSEFRTRCTGRGNVQLYTSGASASTTQQQTSLASVLAFFRGNVGTAPDPNFNKNFNPRYGLPSVITSITKVDRGYMPTFNVSSNLVGKDFTTGTDLCAAGSGDECSGSGLTANVGVVQDHDPDQRAARVNWLSSGPNTYYQANWAAIDVHDFLNLDFRVSRQLNLLDNPPGRTTFSIQLVLANGLSNAVSLCKYVDLRGPVSGVSCANETGPCIDQPHPHALLQTVRIPLGDFGSVDLTDVRGVRFSFNNTSSGSINLANIRFTSGP